MTIVMRQTHCCALCDPALNGERFTLDSRFAGG